ncbi:hypothetical protein [Salsuginibacillus kocurii]|uniref:hypothetical protein n=1 Tax=Salsuginibacillus kocurii TaxID=427078 RepID=UPI0003808C48|nr:hypothetical protein [Salsuginibacillus kocurii]
MNTFERLELIRVLVEISTSLIDTLVNSLLALVTAGAVGVQAYRYLKHKKDRPNH